MYSGDTDLFCPIQASEIVMLTGLRRQCQVQEFTLYLIIIEMFCLTDNFIVSSLSLKTKLWQLPKTGNVVTVTHGY